MIEELQRFIQVAHNGNITQTAKRLFITQSALSQSIHRLEKTLNTKLFSYKGKNLHLTQEGERIQQLAVGIIDLWEKAKDVKKNHVAKTYTIGVFDNAALRLGKYFQKINDNKNITLEIVIDTSETLLTKLHLGILDMVICVVDPKQKMNNNLFLVNSFSEPLIPVAAIQQKGEIQSIPFLLYNKNSHTRAHIDQVFVKHNIVPQIFAESTSAPFMKELATLGCGIALLPENEIKLELKQKLLYRQNLPFSFQRECGIYLAKNGKIAKNDPILTDIIKNLT